MIEAWEYERSHEGLDAIVVNTSGCGSHVKDFGHLLQDDGEFGKLAEWAASITRDVSEIVNELGLPDVSVFGCPPVTYHAPCSLLHGQNVGGLPEQLLEQVGFEVVPMEDKHFCCGSAGVYNLLQADIAHELRERRQKTIRQMTIEFVATGNIGCQGQLQLGLETPVVHVIELLDWAMGGTKPSLHQ
mgnify:CR=1 FL=1